MSIGYEFFTFSGVARVDDPDRTGNTIRGTIDAPEGKVFLPGIVQGPPFLMDGGPEPVWMWSGPLNYYIINGGRTVDTTFVLDREFEGNVSWVVDTPYEYRFLVIDAPAEEEESTLTAAEAFGWGEPVAAASDEFDYEGEPDPDKWQNSPAEGMPGHNGNGRRIAYATTVQDGKLQLRGYENGDTGWIRQKHTTEYGRWEVRSRSENTSAEGALYHVLHLIWPVTEAWPGDGEFDWVEYFDPDGDTLSAYLHYPTNPIYGSDQEIATLPGVDLTEWHNYGFEWTPNGLVGFLDGQEWFRFSGGAIDGRRRDIHEMGPGYYTIQLDNFNGDSGNREALFEIEWVRFYEV